MTGHYIGHIEDACGKCYDKFIKNIFKILGKNRKSRTYFTGPEIRHLRNEFEMSDYFNPLEDSKSDEPDEVMQKRVADQWNGYLSMMLSKKFGDYICTLCNTRDHEKHLSNITIRIAQKKVHPMIRKVCNHCWEEIIEEVKKAING
jgi:hypothetical protein